MKPAQETLSELVAAVASMRYAQKNYFRTRDPFWLAASKRRESDVDAIIDSILKKEPGDAQAKNPRNEQQ